MLPDLIDSFESEKGFVFFFVPLCSSPHFQLLSLYLARRHRLTSDMSPACCAVGASVNSNSNKCGPKSEPPAWMARSSVNSIPNVDSILTPGAVVLLRADLNVPLSPASSDKDDGPPTVLDDARVVAAVPSILYLTSRGARVLLLTHVGRPKKAERGLTTDALVPVLEAALRKASAAAAAAVPPPPVTKIDDCVGPLVAAAASACPEGGVVLLENVRFHAGEEKNDPAFAEALAGGSGKEEPFPPSGSPSPPPLRIALYVNDAFGAAHRAHASTEGVARVLRARGVPCVAGLLLRSELAKLGRVLCCPRRPLVALVGGSKASTKLATIERLAGHADAVELLGGLAATFIVADGGCVGESRVEEGAVDEARALLLRSREEEEVKEEEEEKEASGGGCCGPKKQESAPKRRKRIASISLPVDAVAAKSLKPEDAAAAVVVPAYAVPAGLSAFDAGPETVAAVKALIETAGTVVWNGPAGVFEVSPFGTGTREIAKGLAALFGRVETIVGGGHSVAAVNEVPGLAARFGHVSTGGGASLELLEGRELPGVVALDEGTGLAGVCD